MADLAELSDRIEMEFLGERHAVGAGMSMAPHQQAVLIA
jgi:hypothetical protein